MTADQWADILVDLDGKRYLLALWAWADEREEMGLGLERGLRAIGEIGARPGKRPDELWSWDSAGRAEQRSLPRGLFARLKGGELLQGPWSDLLQGPWWDLRHRPLPDDYAERRYPCFKDALLDLAQAYEQPVQLDFVRSEP